MSNRPPCSGCGSASSESPSPEALVSLRARYNASQKAFGAILGFGELTMNSYESGSTPDSTNRLLLKLAADPLIFKAMYEINSGKIGALQRKRIEDSEGYRAAEALENQVIASRAEAARPRRAAVLEKIRSHMGEYEREFGVTRIGVFGSVAQDEADETSDVDIVVEMRKPDPFYLARIKDSLSSEFGRPVDIVNMHKSMNEALKARIQREAIYA